MDACGMFHLFWTECRHSCYKRSALINSFKINLNKILDIFGLVKRSTLFTFEVSIWHFACSNVGHCLLSVRARLLPQNSIEHIHRTERTSELKWEKTQHKTVKMHPGRRLKSIKLPRDVRINVFVQITLKHFCTTHIKLKHIKVK